jgi:hypothetical protein
MGTGASLLPQMKTGGTRPPVYVFVWLVIQNCPGTTAA